MNYKPLIPVYQAQWMLAGKRSGSGPPPFDPTTIAGLKMWMKADALLPLGDGQSVGLWPDSSANGYNLANAGTGKPVFKTNIVNGHPVLRFDGVVDQLTNPTDIGIAEPYSVFITAKIAITPANNSYMLTTSTSVLIGITQNGYFFIYAGAGPPVGTVDKSAAFHCFACTFTNTSTGAAYADGVLQASGSIGPASLGAIDLMTSAGTTFYAGDVAEVLIYNSALSTTDRQNVEGYLKAKYATP